MSTRVIAYDLGTGGIKASLYDEDGNALESCFKQYETYYPHDKWHEQRPEVWWQSVCDATRTLLETSGTKPSDVEAVSLSGHSLVGAPVDAKGSLLLEQVPIWSDTRSSEILPDFFEKIPNDVWYTTTGNGFPAECYTLFKLMWMRENQSGVFGKTACVLGSKDYINYRMTGVMCTDQSYASGTGAFNLRRGDYEREFLDAASIPMSIMPQIRPSSDIIGTLKADAAKRMGLMEGTKVACGGVDNACMAHGARGVGEGRIYTSLGSSSWIAVTGREPIIDVKLKPYVFAHVAQGYYTSALSIFSGGNSLRWVRDNIFPDMAANPDAYDMMGDLAQGVPAGANGVLFNPALAGGNSLDKSINLRGAFMGLGLGHTRADLVRATMEGIALNLRLALEGIKRFTKVDEEMLFCGGGSKSALWRQIFADIYKLSILKTSVDQDAASLGAAALALKGVGIWSDYGKIEGAHKVLSLTEPNQENARMYDELLEVFKFASDCLADVGDRMQRIRVKN